MGGTPPLQDLSLWQPEQPAVQHLFHPQQHQPTLKLHPSPLLLTPSTSPPPTSPQDTLPTLALMDPPLLLGHPIPLHIPMEEEHLPPPSRTPALPSLMTARETERTTPSLVAARRTRIGG